MFDDKEKQYMIEIGLDLDFDNLSDNDYLIIEEIVGDKLELSEMDRNYNPTQNGLICLSILDKLSKVE